MCELKTAAINGTNRCNYGKMMETCVSDAAADVIGLQASDKPAVGLFHDSYFRIFYLIQENPILRFDNKTFQTKSFPSESFGAVSPFCSQVCNIEAKI